MKLNKEIKNRIDQYFEDLSSDDQLDRINKLIDKNESIKKDVQSYLKGDVDLEYLNEKGIKISQPIN